MESIIMKHLKITLEIMYILVGMVFTLDKEKLPKLMKFFDEEKIKSLPDLIYKMHVNFLSNMCEMHKVITYYELDLNSELCNRRHEYLGIEITLYNVTDIMHTILKGEKPFTTMNQLLNDKDFLNNVGKRCAEACQLLAIDITNYVVHSQEYDDLYPSYWVSLSGEDWGKH